MAAQPKTIDPIIAAHEAYLNHDISALEKLEGRTSQHLLSGYVEFWLMESRLGNALRHIPASDLHRFMAKEIGTLGQLQQAVAKAKKDMGPKGRGRRKN